MVTFRSNNNRRPPFRTNNNRRPPFRSNNEGSKFSNNDNFQRRGSGQGRNSQNASKLIEKYNEMAREALANEDRVLSENYFQHADHFTRVQNEQESIRAARMNSSPTEIVKPITNQIDETKESIKSVKIDEVKKIITEPVIKKAIKTVEKKATEKKTIVS